MTHTVLNEEREKHTFVSVVSYSSSQRLVLP